MSYFRKEDKLSIDAFIMKMKFQSYSKGSSDMTSKKISII